MSAFSYSWDVRRFAFDMSFSDKIPSAASFQSQVIKPCLVEPSASHSFNACEQFFVMQFLEEKLLW